ncbi:MAG: hypothetical protein AMJ93_05480 [Anaerolineae bacterium SM23_84]|nr:MAG: hypothetical protein AMJ93_05480 [Anaerolineae bacterium SM23_84]
MAGTRDSYSGTRSASRRKRICAQLPHAALRDPGWRSRSSRGLRAQPTKSTTHWGESAEEARRHLQAGRESEAQAHWLELGST